MKVPSEPGGLGAGVTAVSETPDGVSGPDDEVAKVLAGSAGATVVDTSRVATRLPLPVVVSCVEVAVGTFAVVAEGTRVVAEGTWVAAEGTCAVGVELGASTSRETSPATGEALPPSPQPTDSTAPKSISITNQLRIRYLVTKVSPIRHAYEARKAPLRREGPKTYRHLPSTANALLPCSTTTAPSVVTCTLLVKKRERKFALPSPNSMGEIDSSSSVG